MVYETRRIFRNKATSQNIVRELLQSVFLTELVAPSDQRVWLVSAWISNIAVVDNRSGTFNAIGPDWGHREVRLAELAIDLIARGAHVGIVTNFERHNDAFLYEAKTLATDRGLQSGLFIKQQKNFHTKGILTSRGLISGSMNLTYNGLEINDETITFDIGSRELASARLNFETYAGI